MRRRFATRHLVHAALTSGIWALWVVAGCGGGGGGSASSNPLEAPPPTATNTLAVTRTPTFTATQSLPAATQTPTLANPTIAPTSISPTSTPFAGTPTSTPTFDVPPPTATQTETETPIPTATETPLTGPIVSALGLADASGTFNMPIDRDDQGRWIFSQRSPAGFIIFVEGRPGPSRLPVGSTRFNYKPRDPSAQPDMQIVSSRDLGTPTQAVCDNAFPLRGGVPAVEPPRFDMEAAVSDALNDLGCRFKLFAETDFACTQDSSGNFVFSNTSSRSQFCTLVDDALTFPTGETILTVRLRDTAGNAGPQAQIVVRISGAS